MQRQPHLIELGMARLELLKTLCLPTLRQQTSQNFLWIIRTDPDLATPVKEGLLEAIRNATEINSQFHVVVIASNESPAGFRRRDEIDALQSDQIWTNNHALYQHFHEAAQSRIVLETRLDADDGLHVKFIGAMQEEAVKHLSNDTQHGNWLVWCMGTHVEWQYGTPWESDNLQLDYDGVIQNGTETAHRNKAVMSDVDHDYGSLLPGLTRGCITPGLTKGYGKLLDFGKLPDAEHHMLHRVVRRCHADDDQNEDSPVAEKHHCLIVWTRLVPCAIRGRTPTSAGMQFVLGPKHTSYLSPESENALGLQSVEKLHARQGMMWNTVVQRFQITKVSIAQLRIFLTEHLNGIAKDNLDGQCTPGHSCKNSSRVILKEILQEIAPSNFTTHTETAVAR
jgi:Putative rhamnosyl transferase